MSYNIKEIVLTARDDGFKTCPQTFLTKKIHTVNNTHSDHSRPNTKKDDNTLDWSNTEKMHNSKSLNRLKCNYVTCWN